MLVIVQLSSTIKDIKHIENLIPQTTSFNIITGKG